MEKIKRYIFLEKAPSLLQNIKDTLTDIHRHAYDEEMREKYAKESLLDVAQLERLIEELR